MRTRFFDQVVRSLVIFVVGLEDFVVDFLGVLDLVESFHPVRFGCGFPEYSVGDRNIGDTFRSEAVCSFLVVILAVQYFFYFINLW